MKRFIYADNAATTSLDPDAFDAMTPYLLNEYGNASQPYSFSRDPKKALANARKRIATILNASPEEIYFTSGGSESDNWAVKGLDEADARRGVVVSSFEHHAVLHACGAVERRGRPVVYLSPNPQGFITAEGLEAAVSRQTRLVSIMTANNEIGTIQPIQKLSAVARRHGALFHTDAVQALGHIPVDVQKLGVDMLSASAHKFNGPKGVGFLYVKNGTPLRPYVDGGKQERGMRAGTENVAGIVGMAVALEKNATRLAENARRLRQLENALLNTLSASGLDYHRNGAEPRLPGCLSLSFKGASGETLLHRLDLMGICVSAGSACDSQNDQISHVLQAIRVDPEYALGTIRVSFGNTNALDDAREIGLAIIKILSQ